MENRKRETDPLRRLEKRLELRALLALTLAARLKAKEDLRRLRAAIYTGGDEIEYR